jgi:hypothetical protein
MKYVVEFNPHHGDPTQAEVEAETIHEAILAAWWRGAPEPEAIDGDKEPSYRAEDGGQPWQRVVINVLPYLDKNDCCQVCGEEVARCESCAAPMTDFSGEVPCCSNPHCEVHP